MRASQASGDIDADYEILEAIGRMVEDLIEHFAPMGRVQRIVRRWLAGHAEPPESEEAQICLMTMASDMELFTPSASALTAVDRHLKKSQPQTQVDRQAHEALAGAQFRLVRIVGRRGPNEVQLEDLVTAESLCLLDARIAPEAVGYPAAMRLCPLASGRHVLISPLFALDQKNLDTALDFARSGRHLGHRLVANLYRDVARRGFLPMPQLSADLDMASLVNAVLDGEIEFSDVEYLALRWIDDGATGQMDDLVLAARQLASVDNLIDACGLYAQADFDARTQLKAAYERIADLQVETLVQRARAGMGRHADALDAADAAIASHITRGAMRASAADLFRRLRTRWTHLGASPSENGVSTATEIERVIQRIQALRAKTVERGCTEEEAMAAAAKVAELLDRHDLTLDEVSVRKSDCLGVNIATGRKRRAPIDSCLQPLAHFCDCQVWSEEHEDGTLHYTLFGLRVDVEAAHVLHELIEATFETETAVFRRGGIYLASQGGNRRLALNSFQIGLANGISARLAALKRGRHGSVPQSTGFDLVAAKHAVVDEEIARLGLHLTTRARRSRRSVHGAAYAAGKAAGDLFEPEAALASRN
ncbi:MAG: DUF2786 domain-containing protein [Alphaproteobacteria bacterium]|nr:DUF2786 domain-containing protein [Alphaproteobacteria bacterium]